MGACRPQAAAQFIQQNGLTQRYAYYLVTLARSAALYHRSPDRPAKYELVERLKQAATKRPRFGCPRGPALLRHQGMRSINSKFINSGRRAARSADVEAEVTNRTTARAIGESHSPQRGCDGRSLEDRTVQRPKLRILTVIDDLTREELVMEVGHRPPVTQMARELAQVIAEQGAFLALCGVTAGSG